MQNAAWGAPQMDGGVGSSVMRSEQIRDSVVPVESVTQAISQTWYRLTGDPPEPGVSFEEAGGDSLGLMELIFILERTLTTKLPLERFHGGLTAEELAREALACASVVRNVAPRQQTLIFFCPPTWDSVNLADFRRTGGDEFRFITIEYPDWRACTARGFGLQTWIDIVRAQIREQLPLGPVRLAGYSSGGLIAYEASVALEAEGREVSLLGILDAPAPGATGPNLNKAAPARLRAWWWAVYRYRIASGGERTRRLAFALAFALASEWVALGRRLLARVPARAARRMNRRSLADWTIYYLTGLLRSAACKRAVAYNRRTEPKLRAPIVLFRCAGQPAHVEPDYGWGYLAEKVIILPVPGDHSSTMTQPHVVQTAAAFVAAQALVSDK